MRQSYGLSFLQRILDDYDLGRIRSFFLYTSGYENSNYFVETERGKYVIKVFEWLQLDPENIRFELEVMDFSYNAGFKTPHILKNRSRSLETVIDGKHCMVMDFIEGENMHKQELSDDLVVEVAQETGKMDVALKHFKDGSKTRQNYEWDLKNTLVLEDAIKFLPEKFDRKVFEEIFEEFKSIKPAFDQLPSGIIHNDVVPHNWLAKNGKLKGIVDFSDMAFSPYIQNMAVSLHLTAFGYNWNPSQARLFLKHYTQFNPLSERELNLLYILIKARFLSFVIECNRWNVEYEMDKQRAETVEDHYNLLLRFIEFGSKQFNQIIDIF